MSLYGEATAAMLRGVEVIAEAAELVKGLTASDRRDSELLERIARRTENSAAQLELDRKLVDEVLKRQYGIGEL